jgi:putative ABC transport system permease protein
MLGIIIGIAAIIAIVSTIKGTNEQIKKNLIGNGGSKVTISLKQGDWDYDMSQGIPSGVKQLTEDEKDSIQSLDHVENASFFVQRNVSDDVYHLTSSLSGGYVKGVDTAYFSTAELAVNRGRGISQNDRDSHRRIAVLDDAAVQQLFGNTDPLGKTIEIKGLPFTVVGQIKEKDSFEPDVESLDDYYTYNQSKTGTVYIPDTAWPSVYAYDEPENVILKADDTGNMTEVGKKAAEILNASLTVTDTTITYKAEDITEQAKQIQQLSQSTNTMLIWIAGISLLVGGIGVMNIMLVSVSERTSEIGLKKAIGARKKAIMVQFLTEAVVLTSIGGILGVICGILLAYLISSLNGTPVAISVEASVIAVLFSMAIGIIFGILPSRKAANLDPIEALRHE